TAQAIIWAVDKGADVINISFGCTIGDCTSSAVVEAINYAFAHNVVIVASSGNNGTSRPNYPAAYPGVIAVGATDANDNLYYNSQYGKHIDFVAPGVSVFSTLPTYQTGKPKNYFYDTGTSMAAPQVAGLA